MIAMLKGDGAMGAVSPSASFQTDILPPTPGVALVVLPSVKDPGCALARTWKVISAIKYVPLGCPGVPIAIRAPRSVPVVEPLGLRLIGSSVCGNTKPDCRSVNKLPVTFRAVI